MVKTYGWQSPEQLKFINENPKVLSLLYDLSILPEEISARVRGYVEEETAKLNLQVGEYRKMLERLEDFGMNAGNWTGNLESSAWNMTPVEDKTLDHLWDEVRALLSKYTEKRKCPRCEGYCGDTCGDRV